MKIMMVANGMDIGGAETHVLELSTALCDKGHLVSVASPFGIFTKELKRRGVKVKETTVFDGSILSFVRQFQNVLEACRHERPDVLHAHTRPGALISALVGRALAIPYVVTFHLPHEKKGIYGQCTRCGDHTLAVSEDIKETIVKEYRIPERNIDVIRNGIDAASFAPRGAVRQSVVHVSRLDRDRSKTASILISLAPSLERTSLCDGVTIIGDGNLFPLLQRKKEEANRKIGYEFIKMPGRQANISRFLENRPVFIGVSRAALEAMACECAIILCGDEGYRGILDPKEAEKDIKTNFCCRNRTEATEEMLLRDLVAALTMPASKRYELGASLRKIIKSTYTRSEMAEIAIASYRSAIKRKKEAGILLCGYYGYGNMGDESALLKIIEKCAPHCGRITVMSRHPQKNFRSYGVRCINRYSLLCFLKSFKKGDILIFGGGNLLQNETSQKSLAYYLSIAWLAGARKGKVAIVRGGIGEVHGKIAQKAVRSLLKSCDYISCRTQEDFRHAKALSSNKRTKLKADAVLLSDLSKKKKAKLTFLDKPYCVIILKKTPVKTLKKKAKKIELFCQKEGLLPVFIALDRKNDRKTAEKATALVSKSMFIQTKDVKKARRIIACSQIVLSERLHGAYFALMENRPFKLLSLTEKNLRHLHYMKTCFWGHTSQNRNSGTMADLPLPLPAGDHARMIAKMVCGGKI